MFGDPALARYAGTEFAIVEPEEDGMMLVQPVGAGRGDLSVPFDVAAMVELRGGNQRVGQPVLLPNGQAIVSELIVTRAEVEEAYPKRLVVVGTGGGQYRANPLHVLAPAGWLVTCGEDETVQLMAPAHGPAHGSRLLWRIEGGATIGTPLGDRYRLKAGQTADERNLLVLQTPPVGQLRTLDAPATIVRGPPSFTVRERGRDRAARHDELWWRRAGSKGWAPLLQFDAVGPCEFAWRDPHTALIHDSVGIIVLPKAFEVGLQSIAGRHMVQIHGWPGSVHVEPGVPGPDGDWTIDPGPLPVTAALVSLSIAGVKPLKLSVRLPHRGFIADWDGHRLLQRARLALTDLHRLVARSSRRCNLHAQLRDKDRSRVAEAALVWPVEGELPLGSIRDELASLLQPFGELDAVVELRFDDADEVVALVSEFAVVLQRVMGDFLPVPVPGSVAHMIGRATHQPLEEVTFGEIAPASVAGPFAMPRLPGTWLVYLRRDELVLSRPIIAFGPRIEELPTCQLARTMAVADWELRQKALAGLCAEAESQGPNAIPIIRAIIALTTKLDGLPPQTFDVLGVLTTRPLLAARLAFEATDAELDTVMALSDGLPFSWSTIGCAWWRKAEELRFECLFQTLLAVFGHGLALQEASRAISNRRRAIGTIDPAAGALLANLTATVSLETAAQTFMHDVHDRSDERVRSPFRPSLTSRLKNWTFDEAYWRCLDAPLAAVLASTGLADLDGPQLRCVKDVARRYPRYFREAFAAFLKETRNA